jgi:hypothetical protein
VIALIGVLSNIWPFLLGGAGILWGVFKHFQANAKIATAGQQVAQAQTAVAQAQTTVAQVNDAASQANATAAAMPAGAAADELRNDWTK